MGRKRGRNRPSPRRANHRLAAARRAGNRLPTAGVRRPVGGAEAAQASPDNARCAGGVLHRRALRGVPPQPGSRRARHRHPRLRWLLRPADRLQPGGQRADPAATARPARACHHGQRNACRWQGTGPSIGAAAPRRARLAPALGRSARGSCLGLQLRGNLRPGLWPQAVERHAAQHRQTRCLGRHRPERQRVGPDPALAASQHRPRRRRWHRQGHPQRDGYDTRPRAAGDAGRPRQPECQQPARRWPGLRCLWRPDRRGQRPRSGRSSKHAGSAGRGGQAGSGHSRHHPLPARAAQHHHRRGAAVRHRRRAAQLVHRAGQPAHRLASRQPARPRRARARAWPVSPEWRRASAGAFAARARQRLGAGAPRVGSGRQRRLHRCAARTHERHEPGWAQLPARLRLAGRRGLWRAHPHHDRAHGGHQLDQPAVPRQRARQPALWQRQQAAAQRGRRSPGRVRRQRRRPAHRPAHAVAARREEPAPHPASPLGLH